VIDTHCHLSSSRFRQDRSQVIARARAAGVTHFVSSSNVPVPLKESEVREILQTAGEEAAKPKASWTVNQSVRVMEGPFAEFSGKITEVNTDRETVKVLISIFGRETPVEVDFTQIERL